MKKGALKDFSKFTGKQLCQSLFFSKDTSLTFFIKKETLVQEFFCEFCEVFKGIFFYRTPPVVASEV